MWRSLSPYTKKQICEAYGNFLSAVLMLGFAIGLSYLEDFLHYTKRPEWLCFGTELISITLFILDGIVIISISGILGARLIRGAADEN